MSAPLMISAFEMFPKHFMIFFGELNYSYIWKKISHNFVIKRLEQNHKMQYSQLQ